MEPNKALIGVEVDEKWHPLKGIPTCTTCTGTKGTPRYRNWDGPICTDTFHKS